MVIFNSYVKLPEGNDVQLVICSQPDIYSTRMWYHQPTTDLCFKVFQAPPPHVDRQFTTALPNFLHFLFGLVKSRCFYPYDPYVDTSWYAMINIYKLQCIYIYMCRYMYIYICIYICVYIYIYLYNIDLGFPVGSFHKIRWTSSEVVFLLQAGRTWFLWRRSIIDQEQLLSGKQT